MTERLSSFALRRPRTTVAAWALVFVVGMVAVGGLFSSLDADLDGSPDLESEQVNDRLDRLDPDGGEVVAVVEGAPVADGDLAGIERIDGVAEVRSLPAPESAGGPGAGTAVAVTIDGGLGEDRHEDVVDAVVDGLRAIDAPEVRVGGEMLLDEEVSDLAERDAQRAETIALPIALVVMAIVFGGVLAAGLPLAIAFGGVAATGLGLAAAATVTDISLYALNVTVMLGLGLGIDYGLLMVSRFREERGAGHDVATAVRRTSASAGRTVLFSAATVAVALVGLLLFDEPTIRSLGLAGIGVVLACAAAGLTLLPALLALVGHRLAPRVSGTDGHVFARVAGVIQRRAVPVVALVGVGLALLSLPFLGARFEDTGVRALPESSETRQVAEAVDRWFPGVTEPVVALADVPADDPALAAWAQRVEQVEGVVEVAVEQASDPGVSVVEVEAEGETNGAAAQSVARHLRNLDAPFPVAVGGDPAEVVDFKDSLTARLPLAAAVIVVATFALLFLMTGSVVVPVKAIVMNILSLSATLGALVWVFQDGHLAGLLGIDPPGALDLVMPLVVFVFAFGLSMDYEVFLLARIREAWLETGDNDRAVTLGLARSGRIITSAALLMVVVFAGFAAGEMLAVKQLGLGLAVAVVVDATIVRTLLVPATMKLLGHWNWWAPAPLARLHARVGLHEHRPEAGDERAPAAAAEPATVDTPLRDQVGGVKLR
jgi:RND superfamily putative drug exporter